MIFSRSSPEKDLSFLLSILPCIATKPNMFNNINNMCENGQTEFSSTENGQIQANNGSSFIKVKDSPANVGLNLNRFHKNV